jgi:UDP:flavonoid glycosyltransferase YjiC (YdhE family)
MTPDQGSADLPNSIVALVGARGGGDRPPVLALAAALRDRMHRVHVLCDGDLGAAPPPARLSAMHLPSALGQSSFYHPLHIPRMASRGETIGPDTLDPLVPWAEACLPHAIAALSAVRPTLLVSSLFCMPLADRLATEFAIPWVFVNPGCYFGDDARRPWQADYPGIVGDMFRHWLLPVANRATVVLHATDPEFDPPPATLPRNHHYVGPLDLPPETAGVVVPNFLDERGAPWVLVTLSTVPQAGEMALARAALAALADQPVRVLLTLAPGHPRDELGPLPGNARVEGFVPHDLVLERACLIIGHAGHGMVMRALRHGVPMVLVPWGRDQTAVAVRARTLGVAEIVPRGECSTEQLDLAIGRVLAGPEHAQAARRTSARLRSEDQLSRACGIVERMMQ